jgi:hypothetical protein
LILMGGWCGSKENRYQQQVKHRAQMREEARVQWAKGNPASSMSPRFGLKKVLFKDNNNKDTVALIV